MRASRALIFAILAIVMTLPAPAAFGQGRQCVLNSECAHELVCRWGYCRQECGGPMDCTRDQLCMLSKDRQISGGRTARYSFCIDTDAISRFVLPRLTTGLRWTGREISRRSLPQSEPLLCLNLCQWQQGCVAWTYGAPGFDGPYPVCALHAAKGTTRQCGLCTAGEKTDFP